MLDAATKSEFDQQFRAVQVLYFAMLASLAGYLVIGLVLDSARTPAVAASSPTVRVFYLLSIGLIVAALLVKKRLVPGAPWILSGRDQAIPWLVPFRSSGKLYFV